MKPAFLLLSVLFLSSALACAQAPSPSANGHASAGVTTLPNAAGQPSSMYVFVPPQACPVSMRASQSGLTDMVKVKQGPNAQPETLSKPSQRIHLVLSGLPGDKRIVGATITARGLTARGHVDNASRSGPADVRRTFDVTFTAEEDKSLSAELVLPGFTSVKSIKLEALQLADGGSRDVSGKRLCSVAPDPLMLVADR